MSVACFRAVSLLMVLAQLRLLNASTGRLDSIEVWGNNDYRPV